MPRGKIRNQISKTTQVRNTILNWCLLASTDRFTHRRNGHCNGTGRAMIRVEQFARMARSCLL
jgi:hypothetical protein